MVKRDGYPEDSTQSAYSSQLIRIPLSAIIFYLSCFISQEASIRQCWGGDQNQLLGGVRARTHTHAHTLHFRLVNDSVCIRYDDECVTGDAHPTLIGWYKLPALSVTLSVLSLSGLTVHCVSAIVTESGYFPARYADGMPLNSLLARLTLLFA